MSAETFTTAMFLITAVIAAGVLINAVFPVVYTMASTFSSSTHASDVRLRTDFVIVTTFSSGTGPLSGQIWMKNIGTQPISTNDIEKSDVFFGPVSGSNSFTHLNYPSGWSYTITGNTTIGYWGPGDTLEIDPSIPNGVGVTSGTPLYFQFVLPTGVWRSTQFNTAGS